MQMFSRLHKYAISSMKLLKYTRGPSRANITTILRIMQMYYQINMNSKLILTNTNRQLICCKIPGYNIEEQIASCIYSPYILRTVSSKAKYSEYVRDWSIFYRLVWSAICLHFFDISNSSIIPMQIVWNIISPFLRVTLNCSYKYLRTILYGTNLNKIHNFTE